MSRRSDPDDALYRRCRAAFLGDLALCLCAVLALALMLGRCPGSR